jgi:hypothetical protein
MQPDRRMHAFDESDIASLSPAEAQAFANFFIRSARSRRHEADLLGHVANALPRSSRAWVRQRRAHSGLGTRDCSRGTAKHLSSP